VVVFLAVYLPAAGRGFVKDDFSWIAGSSIHSPVDAARVVTRSDGFYRPVVGLSFALDEWIGGRSPRIFGWTNVALALLAAAGLAAAATGAGLSRGAAIFAAALWLMNFHGIRWGVLWISGRTSLLAVAGLMWSLAAAARGRLVAAGLCLAAALFSKEEAIFGGAIVAAWLAADDRALPGRRSRVVLWGALALGLTLFYLWARGLAGAMTLSSAPPYYAPALEFRRLAANAAEYFDKTATLPALVAGAAFAILGWPSRDALPPRIAERAMAIIAGGLTLPLGLPVRSDLYALLPACGTCLLAGWATQSAWNASTIRRQRAALVVAALAPVALAPVYVARTHRWSDLARFSTALLDQLDARAADSPIVRRFVLVDESRQRENVTSALGNDPSLAFAVWTGRRLTIDVETGVAARPHTDAPGSVCLTVRTGEDRRPVLGPCAD
jgi:hypothetical protein